MLNLNKPITFQDDKDENGQAISSVALFSNAQTRFFMLDVVREIKRRTSCRVHLYCSTVQELEFYKEQNIDGVLDTVQIGNILLRELDEPVVDPNAEIAKACYYEALIGRTYNSLAVANRHLGRGYALAGYFHPRSVFSENSDYLKMVRAYNRVFDAFVAEHKRHFFSLLLGGSAEIICIARALGLHTRVIAGSKYENYYFWSGNEYAENPLLGRALNKPGLILDERLQLDRPYKLAGIVDAEFRSRASFTWLLRRFAVFTARKLYRTLRRYDLARSYYLGAELIYSYKMWRAYRRMTSSSMRRLRDLDEGSRFVFFPLATEPEGALQKHSPEFFFQHAAIAALSRDLPAGVKLVVKETPVGVGRRPDNFYDQISDLKNVIWLNMHEAGIDVARRAEAVAVISGSTGFEAAVMGKPVISLSKHNQYNVLPHVLYVGDLTQLKPVVDAVLDGSIDCTKAKADGTKYLRAVVETSFDMGPYDFVDLKLYNVENIHAACDSLMKGLCR